MGRPKRVRTIFTTEQLDSMEKAFTMQQYMVGKQRCHLAKTLNLHENQVRRDLRDFHLGREIEMGWR